MSRSKLRLKKLNDILREEKKKRKRALRWLISGGRYGNVSTNNVRKKSRVTDNKNKYEGFGRTSGSDGKIHREVVEEKKKITNNDGSGSVSEGSDSGGSTA